MLVLGQAGESPLQDLPGRVLLAFGDEVLDVAQPDLPIRRRQSQDSDT